MLGRAQLNDRHDMQAAIELTSTADVEPHVGGLTAIADHWRNSGAHGECISVAAVAHIADVPNQTRGDYVRRPAQLQKLRREGVG